MTDRFMRVTMLLALAVLPILKGADPDPADLRVILNGDRLSYEVVNKSPYRIIGFQVYTQFRSDGYENLGCGINAQVKSPTDLVVRDVCTVPHDEKTGKLIEYRSQLVIVKFANGITWSPGVISEK